MNQLPFTVYDMRNEGIEADRKSMSPVSPAWRLLTRRPPGRPVSSMLSGWLMSSVFAAFPVMQGFSLKHFFVSDLCKFIYAYARMVSIRGIAV